MLNVRDKSARGCAHVIRQAAGRHIFGKEIDVIAGSHVSANHQSHGDDTANVFDPHWRAAEAYRPFGCRAPAIPVFTYVGWIAAANNAALKIPRGLGLAISRDRAPYHGGKNHEFGDGETAMLALM